MRVGGHNAGASVSVADAVVTMLSITLLIRRLVHGHPCPSVVARSSVKGRRPTQRWQGDRKQYGGFRRSPSRNCPRLKKVRSPKRGARQSATGRTCSKSLRARKASMSLGEATTGTTTEQRRRTGSYHPRQQPATGRAAARVQVMSLFFFVVVRQARATAGSGNVEQRFEAQRSRTKEICSFEKQPQLSGRHGKGA